MKKMLFSSSLAIGLLLSNNILANDFRKELDVSGVKTGISIKEAEEALKKINPDFTINTLHYENGDIEAYLLSKEGIEPYYASDLTFVSFSENGKVTHVNRKISLNDENRITSHQLLNALKEKYGSESYTGGHPLGGNYHTVWDFDRDGNLYTDTKNTNDSYCNKLVRGLNLYNLLVPDNTMLSKCGLLIRVQYNFEKPGEDYLKGYTIAIIDGASLYDDAKKEQDLIREAKRKAKEEKKQKALSNKPII